MPQTGTKTKEKTKEEKFPIRDRDLAKIGKKFKKFLFEILLKIPQNKTHCLIVRKFGMHGVHGVY